MEGSESTYEECGYIPSYNTLSESAIYLNGIPEKKNKTLPTDNIIKQNSNPVVDNVSVKSTKHLFLCKSIFGAISGIMVLAVIMAISFTYSRPISLAEKEAKLTVNHLNVTEFDTGLFIMFMYIKLYMLNTTFSSICRFLKIYNNTLLSSKTII